MLLRSARAASLAALFALAGACDAATAPSSTATTELQPPPTNPAFPAAKGSASFEASANERELEVQVEDVPPGTPLSFFYNDNNIGNVVADAAGRARVNLNTSNGDLVPFNVVGAAITVQSEGILVVSGSF